MAAFPGATTRVTERRKAPVELHVLPTCMMAVTPSAAVSQYIDIYIVFPLGCSQGAQGGWSPGAVAGMGITTWGLIPFTCEAMVAEPLSIVAHGQ